MAKLRKPKSSTKSGYRKSDNWLSLKAPLDKSRKLTRKILGKLKIGKKK